MEGEAKGISCRYCGKPIAVPASRCPWCDRQIMIICAACRQYTDDSLPHCQHCGAPLQEDTKEAVKRFVGLQPEIADLVTDRERALLTASGVVASYLPSFFFDDGQRRTVFVDLFGTPPTPRRTAAALLLSAIAYLIEKGYCDLQEVEGGKLEWVEVRPWDGQVRSLEGAMAEQAGLRLTIGEALDRMVKEQMQFDYEVVKPPRVRTPGMPKVQTVRNLSARSALNAVVELGRQVILPEHEENTACAETYRLLLTFVRASPERVRYLVQEIEDVLDWFQRYEEDPTLALTRREGPLPWGQASD